MRHLANSRGDGPVLASSSASLHLGPIHVVCEAAASEAATALAGQEARGAEHAEFAPGPENGTEMQVEDWEVHFVAPGRNGPFLARAEAWRGPAGRVLSRFTLCDEGAQDAVVASGTAAFRVSGTFSVNRDKAGRTRGADAS